MADKLKYSTTQPTLPGLRTDDFVLGTGDGNYGPTSTTSYLNGFTAPEGGYVVYTLGLSNTPIGWVASNDAELIDISRHLGNTTLDIKAAKVYLADLADTWVFNSTPNNIITDGLECYVDGLNLTSYPETGTSWYDISGRVRTHTIQNTPSFDPSLGLLFDGVDDSVNIDPNSYRATQTPGTMEVVFKPLDASSPQVIAATTENRDRIISIVDGGHIRGCQYNGVLGDFCGGQHLPTIFEKYHHVAFAYTVDNGNGNSEYTLWVDGEEVANQLLDITTTVGNDTNVNTLGGTSFNFTDGGSRNSFNGVESSTGFFNGRISKFLTHNRFLSETEIKQNYYGGSIVTDGLTFALDAGNLVSYEPADVFTYSLIDGSIPPGEVLNGVGYTPSYGGGWDFDGTNDYIYFNHNLTNPDEFTIEAVINMTSLGNYNKTIMYSGNNSTEGFWFLKHRSGLGNRLIFHGYDGVNPRIDVTSTDQVPDAENVYVAVTYVGGTYQLYMNGLPNGPAVNDNPIAPSLDNAIGKIGSTYMEGKIYNLRMYGRGLSPSEIQQNFEAQRSRFGI